MYNLSPAFLYVISDSTGKGAASLTIKQTFYNMQTFEITVGEEFDVYPSIVLLTSVNRLIIVLFQCSRNVLHRTIGFLVYHHLQLIHKFKSNDKTTFAYKYARNCLVFRKETYMIFLPITRYT